jgi:hypothetical protein
MLKSIIAALLVAIAMSSPAPAATCSPEALAHRDVIRELLSDVAQRGFRGEHHFSITFLTAADGVRLPARLVAKYPREMTIVLQYQFEHLTVTEDRFAVVLWFKGLRERVVVPLNAITLFIDPSVNVRIETDPASRGQRCSKANQRNAVTQEPAFAQAARRPVMKASTSVVSSAAWLARCVAESST